MKKKVSLEPLPAHVAECGNPGRRRRALISLILLAVGGTSFVAAYFWGLQVKAAEPAVAENARRPSKLDLTPESFDQIRAAIRPRANEYRHLKVKWYTDIVAARKKAAQEDKPIVFFRTLGAGYNDPLGVC